MCYGTRIGGFLATRATYGVTGTRLVVDRARQRARDFGVEVSLHETRLAKRRGRMGG